MAMMVYIKNNLYVLLSKSIIIDSDYYVQSSLSE